MNQSLIASAAIALSFTVAAQAASLTPVSGLTGNTTSEGWNDLSSSAITGYGTFPGTGAWPGPIASQIGPDAGTSGLSKTANGLAGGPYAASGSMYFGGFSSVPNTNGGTLGVSPTVALAGLQTVVFQIEIGEAMTYDFYNQILPTLTYTVGGMSTTVAASYSSLYSQVDNGTVSMPTGEETVYINAYALQWDLSSVTGEITGFSVDFTAVQHGQLYSLHLQQSDEAFASSLLPTAIPEPASLSLLGAGALAFLRRRRA